jgi:hypothetical protein
VHRCRPVRALITESLGKLLMMQTSFFSRFIGYTLTTCLLKRVAWPEKSSLVAAIR